MTNTEVDPRVALAFLRRLRELTIEAGGSIDLRPLMIAVDDLSGTWMASDLVVWLRERGLICRDGVRTTTSPEANRLLDEVVAMGVQLLAEFEPCGYTFSHTREWCGKPYCREA